MKSRFAMLFAAVTMFAALAIPTPLAAQDNQDRDHHVHHHYKVIDTGTLGGPSSFLGFEGSRSINNHGVIAAGTDTSMPTSQPFCLNDCFVEHATSWQEGVLTDLGTIPNGNGAAVWISDTGLIAGLSLNGLIDPVTGLPELEAVLWKDGGPINLGTFGGTQSIAGSVNDSGQVVGCATNGVSDSFSICMGVPQATQSRAFLWQDGAMQDLSTLGGPDANAFLVNEHGQITGWSSTNTTPSTNCPFPLTTHTFLWESGKMTDLGTLGGTCSFPNWLNDRGEVVGQSNLAGDSFTHPFLWRQGKMRDLGTLGGNFGNAISITEAGDIVGWATTPGDQVAHGFLWERGHMSDLGVIRGKVCSIAYAINSKRQIVGVSDDDCFGQNAHAFLWEDGSLVDLDTFVSPNSGVQLTFALSINEHGEIASLGLLPNGDQHAFALIPCDENHPNLEGCDYSLIAATAGAPQPNPAGREIANRAPLPPRTWQPSRFNAWQRRRFNIPGRAIGPRN
jgi:probable HAF family extracellular repeat protein